MHLFRGLLSAHILADLLQQRDGVMTWYTGELLNMAKDIGYRLLPAFNTTTGIPYSRVSITRIYYIIFTLIYDYVTVFIDKSSIWN